MSARSRMMNLGVFVINAGNHNAGWRFPGAYTNSEDFPAILDVARIAERTKLDFVFFADTPVCLPDNHPGYVLQLEPTAVLAALAACTSHIGLVATVSSTFTEPYNLARVMASIDRISGGRVGWNVVTTSTADAALNFGRGIPPHDQRYEMAAEYLEIVQGLWDSWEDGARIADKTTGQYIDTRKVHVLDHKGKYYSVRGPLNNSRSPQGQPVIVQAGSSASGQQFAARYAEVVFTVQQDMGEARKFYAGVKEKAVAAGRSLEDCRILPGLFPIVGRTESEAREKFVELTRYIVPGSALRLMSERYGHDMSLYPMDGPVPDLPLSEAVQSFSGTFLAKARRENLKLKDIHDMIAISRGYILISGTPKTIADTMEEWFMSHACDGFMITPAHFPASLVEFGELVVPELQRRGLFRTEYEGSTLRSILGLSKPRYRFVEDREEITGSTAAG